MFYDWTSFGPLSPAQTFVMYNSQLYIKTPNLLNYSRWFFRCSHSRFRGIPIYQPTTQNTGQQLYWNKKIVFNDIMTYDFGTNPVITAFTGQFLIDSGWYDIDFSLLPFTNWGYRVGCDMVTQDPSLSGCTMNTSQFLGPVGKQTCSSDYRTKGSIQTADSYLGYDTCPIFKRVSTFYTANLDCTVQNRSYISVDSASLLVQEYYGPDSRCFVSSYKQVNVQLSANSTVTLPTCQRFQCATVNSKYQLTIYFDNQAIVCPYYGGVVTLGLGSSRSTYFRFGRKHHVSFHLRLLQDRRKPRLSELLQRKRRLQ